MKKIIFFLTVFLAFGLFSACNDDDEGITNFAEGMEGIYRGNLAIMDGNEEASVPCRIGIVRVDDQNITMNVHNFSYKNISYGNLETQQITAGIEDGKYILRGVSKVEVKINQVDSAVLLNVDGSISGTILRFNGTVALGNKTAVNVYFYGQKLATISEASITEVSLTGAEKVNLIEKNIFFTMPLGTKDEALKSLTPQFTISQGAKISPEGPQDFSAGKSVEYKVTSGDKSVVTVYHAVCINGSYNFENWLVANPTVSENLQYSEPLGYWGTSNSGLASVMSIVSAYKGGYNVTIGEGRNGSKAAVIVTKNTLGSGGMIPKITSGTLFLGEFVTDINEPLNSTHFGIPVIRKPLQVDVWFSYTPGDEYYHCADPKAGKGSAELDATRKDSCAISVVLYKAGYTLNGTNLLVDNENIIAKAVLPKERTGSTSGYFQQHSLVLDYGSNAFDPAQKYKLAVVFASSKNGDKYSGAPGSTLCVDNVEIKFE